MIVGVETADDAAEGARGGGAGTPGAGGSKIKFTTAFTTAIVTLVWCAPRRKRCASTAEVLASALARSSYAARIHARVCWSVTGCRLSWNVLSSYCADVLTR